MGDRPRFRHELKYEINYGDYLLLRERLKTVMKTDGHTDKDGKYLIRSLYFDNYKDKALHEKLDGVDDREKYRFRYYGNNFSFIRLEKKIKKNNLCMKKSIVITKDECEKILVGEYEWMAGCGRELIQELYIKINTEQLRPKTIVAYIREPYVFPVGNVRVTFDMNVSTSMKNTDFFNMQIPLFPAIEKGKMLLEVKYDDFFPEVIRCFLQIGYLRHQSYSKYGACRNCEI